MLVFVCWDGGKLLSAVSALPPALSFPQTCHPASAQVHLHGHFTNGRHLNSMKKAVDRLFSEIFYSRLGGVGGAPRN